MTATGSRGRPEDGRHNVHETRNGFEAIQLFWKNPPMLHVFPVEAHPSARGVEEERMDDVHRLPVAREDRFSGGAEHDCAEPGLFANLPRDGVTHRLADVDRATGQPPLPAIGALLEQKSAAAVEDDGRDRGSDSESACGVTLERDHPFTLPDAHALRNVLHQPPAALNRRWNCFHAIGDVAPTFAFSSTCALVFMPTSAVPTPGVERAN